MTNTNTDTDTITDTSADADAIDPIEATFERCERILSEMGETLSRLRSIGAEIEALMDRRIGERSWIAGATCARKVRSHRRASEGICSKSE